MTLKDELFIKSAMNNDKELSQIYVGNSELYSQFLIQVSEIINFLF